MLILDRLGPFPNPKSASCLILLYCERKIPTNFVGGWKHFSPFLYAKTWKCISVEALNE